jgi:hypothetical protein
MAFAAILFALLTPTILRADPLCDTAGNLVQNCSFGNGNLSGADWALTNAAQGSLFAFAKGGYNGDNAAAFSAFDNQYDTISQTLSTTAGATYTLSFWLKDKYGFDSSVADFQALWDGVSVLNQYTAEGWTEYTFTVTASSSGSDTLTFEGYNLYPSYYLSDISVTEDANTAATPEPCSIMLLGSGVAALAAVRRKRAASQASNY